MTDKVTLSNIASFQNDSTAVAQYTSNNAAITAAMDVTLSRDGTSPNQMGANLDMNSHQIINLPAPNTVNSPARLIDITNPIVVPNNILGGNNVFTGTNSFSITPTFPNIPAFFAHKNGASQTGIPNNSYTLITFGTTKYNRGNLYNTSTSAWVPPAGIVLFSAEALISSGCDTSGNNLINYKIIKNGVTDVVSGQSGPNSSFPGVASVQTNCFDLANGTDSYQIFLFLASAGNNAVVDGNAAHTYFSGVWLGS